MKNILAIVATVGVLLASGSAVYYYTVFLPQQNIQSQKDLSAIRSVVAPTPEQQKVNQQNAQKQMEEATQKLNDYLSCENNMQKKRSAVVTRECPFDPGKVNYFDWSDCQSRVMKSAEYQQYQCPMPY